MEPVNLTPNFTDHDGAIRALLVNHLPHGSKGEIAAVAHIHANQVSRQLSGDDGLHDKTVNAAIWILRRYPELAAVVTAIHMLRNGDVSSALVQKSGLLIEFGTGQLCIPGMK